MGQTRGQLKTTIRENLADQNVTFYTDTDLNNSLQDAYDDIACLTQCISKSVTLNWISELSYYDFKNLGVSDYLGCTAIFNHVTNMWLRDDLTLRDFDRIRRDWELWIGTPQFWAPSDFQRIAVAGKYKLGVASGGAFYGLAFSNAFYIDSGFVGLGTFDLYYWAVAPVLVDDSSTFLIASDMQNLLEFYSTADRLEDAQEFIKANEYWEKYYNGIEQYAARVKQNNKTDLLLRV